MSDYLVQEIAQTPNIRVRAHTEVIDGQGSARLERLTLRDRSSGATETVPAAALFVLISGEPRTQWLADTVQRDEADYVVTGVDLLRGGTPAQAQGWPLARPPSLLETSVPGVFAGRACWGIRIRPDQHHAARLGLSRSVLRWLCGLRGRGCCRGAFG